jgi:hypothetical protein
MMRPLSPRRAIVVLIALQIALFATVEPRGEFPLNDDWAYAHSVQWLLTEHRVHVSDWAAMNLLPQTLAGGATASVFGFSFTALRHLTQLVALFASAAMLWLFRTAGLTPAQALFAGLAVAITPWWIALANSFMTDFYAIALALPAAALYLRALRSDRQAATGTLIAGVLLSVLGVLQRQVVLVLPFAFGCAWLAARAADTPHSLRSLRNWARAVAPLVASISAIALYKAYLISGPGLPAAQQQIEGRVFPMLGRLLLGDPFYWLWSVKLVSSLVGFTGLVAAGFAIVLLGRGGGTTRQRAWVMICAGVLIVLVLAGAWVPPFRPGQLITATGLGPYSLFDVLGRLQRDLPTPAPELFWRVCGIAAAFGASAFLVAIAAAVRTCWQERARNARRLFLLVVVLSYLLPFAITDYIDRYLLFVLPFILLLLHDAFGVARAPPRRSLVGAGSVLMLILALSSAAATHDYFAWNRARWAAIAEAGRRGATPDTLDGGFEYNGFNRFQVMPQLAVPGKSWWWVKDDQYCVSFEPRQGYAILQTWSVRAWLPTTPGQVFLLKRIEG